MCSRVRGAPGIMQAVNQKTRMSHQATVTGLDERKCFRTRQGKILAGSTEAVQGRDGNGSSQAVSSRQ